MSFFSRIRNTQKDTEDYKRDLEDLVSNLPGVQGILDWQKCGTDKFAVGDDGKKFTAEYGMGTITILIEDQQYIVKYTEDGSEWSEERKYDGKSKIETERTTNHTHGDIVRCVRDINNLEKVDVYSLSSDGKMTKDKSCNIAAPLGSISKGMEFDIATLEACGGLRFFTSSEPRNGYYRRYQDCKEFTKRDKELVRKAVGKSKHAQQCCQYDKTVQEMDGKTQY